MLTSIGIHTAELSNILVLAKDTIPQAGGNVNTENSKKSLRMGPPHPPQAAPSPPAGRAREFCYLSKLESKSEVSLVSPKARQLSRANTINGKAAA